MRARTAYSARARAVAGPSSVFPALVVLLSMVGFAAPGFAQNYTVTATPDLVAVGPPIYGCWTAPPAAHPQDWILLVPIGRPSNEYVTGYFTGGAESGCAPLFASSPGTYEVRYLTEGGFDDVAASSNPVSVVVPSGSVFFDFSPPPQVIAGRQVHACWSATADAVSSADLIGLFAIDVPSAIALATQGTLGAETGCASFTVPAVGGYEIRYLSGGTLDAAAVAFTAIPSPGGGYGVTATPSSVAVGPPIYACWTAPAEAHPFDWIVLVPIGRPSSAYVTGYFTGGAESGCTPLYAGSPGNYEVRYLIEGGFTDVASSDPVSVVVPSGSVLFSSLPLEVIAGREVYACWSATPDATSSSDTIGLFETDPASTNALATRGTCGAETGCASFTVPATGGYEIRYLSGGTLDAAAVALTAIPSPGAYGLTATDASGPSGPAVEACWTAPAEANPFDWIVLVPIGRPSSAYLTGYFTGGAQNGCASLFVSPPGTFEVRYLIEGGFTDVASTEVALANAPALLHGHEWKMRVTSDPQNHPRFDVGDEVTMLSYVPRAAADRLPADSKIGDYGTGFVRLGSTDLDPPWTFGKPQPTFTIYDGFATTDGVRFDAAANGRSVAISCLADTSFYANDGFKTRDVPVPALDCPGAASEVTFQDSSPAAVVDGELACMHYLPEPSPTLSIATGLLALSAALRRRRPPLDETISGLAHPSSTGAE